MNTSTQWGVAVLGIVIIAAAMVWYNGREPMEEPLAGGPGKIVETDSAQPETSAGAQAEPNMIYLASQVPGDSVQVSTVVLTDSGYVVIHENANGAPGAIVGVSDILSAGKQTAVRVGLAKPMTDGSRFFAMLHTDNGDAVFDAAVDAPVMSSLGGPIMMEFFAEEGAADGAIEVHL